MRRVAPVWPVAALTVLSLPFAADAWRQAPSAVLTLSSIGALPVHLSGQLRDPVGFVQASNGMYLVLDRREHTVYEINASRTTMRRILKTGFEQGLVLGPAVLALSRDDIFAVADAPNGLERIQYFGLDGTFLGGFYLQSRMAPRVVIDGLVLNGAGSMDFTGRTFLLSRPESGALFSELDTQGRVLRQIGTLRSTGHEDDRDLHVALNSGLPLAAPGGGDYFVFQTGVPMFRRYDAAGALVFERHIEGAELDAAIQQLPTEWPRRETGARLPLVEPLVRTAAVDRAGRLWVSLAPGVTYVYDPQGNRIRTVRFKAAGLISPTSLFFTKDNRILVAPGCYEFAGLQ